MDFDRRPHSRWYMPQQDVPSGSTDGHAPAFAHSEHSQARLDALTGIDHGLVKHPHGEDAELHKRSRPSR